MMTWVIFDLDQGAEALGLIPQFLRSDDPRPAREQLNERYQFGGWQPMSGFTLGEKLLTLNYPDDPPLKPFGFAILREEVIAVYPHGWVAIFQMDKSFEIARLD